MLTRRKKSQLAAVENESYYISTAPTPLDKDSATAPEHLKSGIEALVSSDEQNTETNVISEQETISSHKTSNLKHNLIVEQDSGGGAADSDDSDLENLNRDSIKCIKKLPPKRIKYERRNVNLKGKDRNTNSTGKIKVHYSAETEKSLENFLFGKPTEKGRCKQNGDGSDSSDSSEDSSWNEAPAQKRNTTTKEHLETNEETSSEEDEDSEQNSAVACKKGSSIKQNKSNEYQKRRPAWLDKDDEQLQVKDVAATFTKARGKHGGKDASSENYANSLRRKFTALKDTPKWANFESRGVDAEDDSDDEFFRESTDMLESGKRDSLAKGFLDYRKLKDMNEQTHCEGTVIRAAEFHPMASVGLVAGLNGTCSLFQIDGKTNPKMQTVNFENFPVKTAHFTADGSQFIAGSQHFGHFFVYDMLAGRTIRVPWKEDGEGSVQKFEVSPAGDFIAFHGRFGNIHFYSQNTRTKGIIQ